jgi:hypothetical protein
MKTAASLALMSFVIAATAVGIDRSVDPAAASSQSAASPGPPVPVSDGVSRAAVDAQAASSPWSFMAAE